jgi:heterodisulfide reductase subunit A2
VHRLRRLRRANVRQRRPDEFNAGLSNRGAAYIHFPRPCPKKRSSIWSTLHQLRRAQDRRGAQDQRKNRPSRFYAPCERACPAEAINRSDRPRPQGEIVEVKVGSIVVATGYKVMEKGWFKEMAPDFPNVITALQLERLISATGPTGGAFLRPSDQIKPHTVTFVSCMGSRDENFHTHCSRVCCMYMIKQARLLKEKYRRARDQHALHRRAHRGQGLRRVLHRRAEDGHQHLQGQGRRPGDAAGGQTAGAGL